MKTQFARVIGVDVSSLRLDINDSAGKIKSSLPNTVDAVSKQLIQKIDDRSATLVVCEATGSYEHVLVDACHLAGIAICIANPRQVRDFAKGHERWTRNAEPAVAARRCDACSTWRRSWPRVTTP